MQEPAVCIFSKQKHNYIDSTLASLQKSFICCQANHSQDIQRLLEDHSIFCILFYSHTQAPKDSDHIRKLYTNFSRYPILLYLKVEYNKFSSQPNQIDIEEIFTNENKHKLMEKLQQLKRNFSFHISLEQFHINLDQCKHYWTYRFVDFVIKNNNFLKYSSVSEIADVLGTSVTNLVHIFKKDYWITPKQLLLCLRNYYAAYLLDTTCWSSRKIAYICGFANEFELYRSFRDKTGMTVLNFRREKSWQDYPSLYLEKHHSKMTFKLQTG